MKWSDVGRLAPKHVNWTYMFIFKVVNRALLLLVIRWKAFIISLLSKDDRLNPALMTLLPNIHPVYHFENPLIVNGHGKNVASRLWWGEAAFQGVHYIILLLLQGNSASFIQWDIENAICKRSCSKSKKLTAFENTFNVMSKASMCCDKEISKEVSMLTSQSKAWKPISFRIHLTAFSN